MTESTVTCDVCGRAWMTLDPEESRANHKRVHHPAPAHRPRILITGSRDWDRVDITRRAILRACGELGTRDVIVVHGGCKGADLIARDVAISLGMMHEDHTVTPEEWARIGKKAGPMRNQKMVDLGADVCLAFPLRSSRGTFDCMRRARDAGIPVKNWGFLSPNH